jgi:hypothetical protein
MKQIKRIQCGRIDGKYYRTTVYTDGSAFGVVDKRKRMNVGTGIEGENRDAIFIKGG